MTLKEFFEKESYSLDVLIETVPHDNQSNQKFVSVQALGECAFRELDSCILSDDLFLLNGEIVHSHVDWCACSAYLKISIDCLGKEKVLSLLSDCDNGGKKHG